VIYSFIEAQKANHLISRMCRLLRVSKSGFYDWRDRAPSGRAQADAVPSDQISVIHTASRQTYEAPSIHFELRTLGVRCARKRVARLMREETWLFGCLRQLSMAESFVSTLKQGGPWLKGKQSAETSQTHPFARKWLKSSYVDRQRKARGGTGPGMIGRGLTSITLFLRFT
jgi:hypothetical protein